MAFGYTGLAKWQGFSTHKWLLNALDKSGQSGYLIGDILESLRQLATYEFTHNPLLSKIPPAQKALSVMFSGYINIDGAWKQGCAVLSNYLDFETNNRMPNVSSEFQIHYSSARNDVENPTLVQRVGNWSAMTDREVEILRRMLETKKPSKGIIGKANQLVRRYSDNPKTHGTIGKQLTAISIPRDISKGIATEYSSGVVKRKTFMPSMVYLLEDRHMVVDNISITPVEKSTAPISVPRVRRNAPCPCGSGRKFKFCHGQKTKS